MDVLTGASTRVAEILDAAGLADDFRVLIGGDQVTAPKPDPGGSELACRQLGLRPADCAYLGEPPTDLEAASRSGALPLAAGWGISISPRTTPAPTSSSPQDLMAQSSDSRQQAGIAGVAGSAMILLLES